MIKFDLESHDMIMVKTNENTRTKMTMDDIYRKYKEKEFIIRCEDKEVCAYLSKNDYHYVLTVKNKNVKIEDILVK